MKELNTDIKKTKKGEDQLNNLCGICKVSEPPCLKNRICKSENGTSDGKRLLGKHVIKLFHSESYLC